MAGMWFVLTGFWPHTRQSRCNLTKGKPTELTETQLQLTTSQMSVIMTYSVNGHWSWHPTGKSAVHGSTSDCCSWLWLHVRLLLWVCQDTSEPGHFGPIRLVLKCLADTLALVSELSRPPENILLQQAVQRKGLMLHIIIKEKHWFYNYTQEHTAKD